MRRGPLRVDLLGYDEADEGGSTPMADGKKRITITLPESLATQAKAEGLLTPGIIEQILREEIRRRRLEEFGTMLRQLHEAKIPAMTEEELEAEIQTARCEQQASNAACP